MTTDIDSREVVHRLKAILKQVECWNFIENARYDLPAGTFIRITGASTATTSNILVVDEDGMAIGIDCGSASPSSPRRRTGYRFIVDNVALDEALDIDVPAVRRDGCSDLIDYRMGKVTHQRSRMLQPVEDDHPC